MNEEQLAEKLEKARSKSSGIKSNSGLLSTDAALTSGPAGTAMKAFRVKKMSGKITHALTHWPEHIEWSTDGIILIPLFFADIKDILDLVGFSLPGINEAMNFSIMGFSALVFAFIGASSGKAKRAKTGIRSMMKWFVLLAGTTIEEIFGINFLPIESLSIIIAFVLVVWERMKIDSESEPKREANEEMSYA